MKTRTKFTVCAITAIMLYTVTAMALTAYDKVIPDSLTVAYFSAWTVELGLLFGLRIRDRE